MGEEFDILFGVIVVDGGRGFFEIRDNIDIGIFKKFYVDGVVGSGVNGVGMDGVGVEFFEEGDVMFVGFFISERVDEVGFFVESGISCGGVLLVGNVFYEELGIVFVEEFGVLYLV